MTSLDFSHDDLARAARYHRPRYIAFGAAIGLSAATYAFLAWSSPGRWVWRLVDGLGWAGAAAAWAALVVVIADLVQLPLAYWRGLARERAWGFSQQTARDWLPRPPAGGAVSFLA